MEKESCLDKISRELNFLNIDFSFIYQFKKITTRHFHQYIYNNVTQIRYYMQKKFDYFKTKLKNFMLNVTVDSVNIK